MNEDEPCLPRWAWVPLSAIGLYIAAHGAWEQLPAEAAWGALLAGAAGFLAGRHWAEDR